MLGFPAFRDLVSFFLGVNNKAAPDNDDDDDDDDDDVAMGGVGSVVFQILNFFLLFSFFFSSLRKKKFDSSFFSASSSLHTKEAKFSSTESTQLTRNALLSRVYCCEGERALLNGKKYSRRTFLCREFSIIHLRKEEIYYTKELVKECARLF
jgi:hypothetical protein